MTDSPIEKARITVNVHLREGATDIISARWYSGGTNPFASIDICADGGNVVLFVPVHKICDVAKRLHEVADRLDAFRAKEKT